MFGSSLQIRRLRFCLIRCLSVALSLRGGSVSGLSLRGGSVFGLLSVFCSWWQTEHLRHSTVGLGDYSLSSSFALCNCRLGDRLVSAASGLRDLCGFSLSTCSLLLVSLTSGLCLRSRGYALVSASGSPVTMDFSVRCRSNFKLDLAPPALNSLASLCFGGPRFALLAIYESRFAHYRVHLL